MNRAYLRYLLWLSRYDEAARHLERVCQEAGPGAHAATVAGRDIVALVLGRFVSTGPAGCGSTIGSIAPGTSDAAR